MTFLNQSPTVRVYGVMIPAEFHALYPGLTDEELAAIKDSLDQYLLLAWEIMAESSTGTQIDSGDDQR